MTDPSLIVLPQRWAQISTATTLEAAAEKFFASWYGDERDCAGNTEDGQSFLAESYQRRDHPVPDYGSEARRCRLTFQGGFPYRIRDDVEVIQPTATVMPPAAALAYLDMLWRDPEHPVVQTHTDPSIKLNGSPGYFMVDGPALAVPVHDPAAGKPAPARPRGRRGTEVTMPTSAERIKGLTRFEVEVENPDGVTDADFEWAARRHPSLGPHDFLTGGMVLRDIVRVDGELVGRTPGAGARPMVKVTGPSGLVGIFDDVPSATAALHKHVEADERRDRDWLRPLDPYDFNLDSYEIEGCIVDGEGERVRSQVEVRMTRARAAVYSAVATVEPGTRQKATGFALSWFTRDWHRNKLMAELNPGGDGPLYRPESRRYRW